MTGRERVALAMGRDRPDRVPVMCQMAMGHICLKTGLSPLEVWHDPETYAEALLRMREQYSFDGILVSLPGGDPDWRDKIGERRRDDKAEYVKWSAAPRNPSPYPLGDQTVYPRDDLPSPVSPTPPPRLGELDPETIDILDPVPDWMLSNLRTVMDRAGDEWSIHGETFSPFDKVLEVLGMEGGLMALLDDPAKVHRILEKGCDYAANWGVAQALEGCDAVKISSPYVGGGFLSRNVYREFVLPYEAELVSRIRKAAPDIPVYTHTCGAIGDRLELMADSGTNGLECLDPPPLGDVELEDAVRRVGDRLFIKGNVDSVNTLLFRGPEAIRADVESTVRAGMKAPGYLLSTACSIAPGVPEGHVRVMAEVAEEIGHYD